MAWYGDSKGHAEAGRKGGRAQGKRNNPGNFANDREKARLAGRRGGSAHPHTVSSMPGSGNQEQIQQKLGIRARGFQFGINRQQFRQ